ncbi:MAG: nucleotidyl transferase AbiEii/AbiGii toxin family protein [Deltaproteobacteria bacterium]|nr:nucleotidyl transferase AbiEii/AbiGii toxin family protein [Deltaproteobacteria bacterium]
MSINKLLPHLDKNIFREAIQFTQKQTGFSARLIEKDYYCSVILSVLYSKVSEMISHVFFKGGTLLNKVHVGFYRLSEDLDFTISTSPKAKRSERSHKASEFKTFIELLHEKIACLKIEKPLVGSNNSVQYNATIKYQSVLIDMEERILFEIGLREEVYAQNNLGDAATLVQDPYTEVPLLPLVRVKCLTLKEAFAEKIRAALSREKAAIRDVYDLWYATEKKVIDFEDSELIDLVIKKMSAPEPLLIKLDLSRKNAFKAQVDTQLKPVLRDVDFDMFDFDQGWKRLLQISELIQKEIK